MALPQPEHSENDAIDGDIAPVPSLAGGRPAGAPPGAVWLTMCAWCNRLRIRGRWIEAAPSSAVRGRLLTHGICPSCFEEATAHTRRARESESNEQ